MIFLLRKKQLLQYISMYIFLVTHDELVQYIRLFGCEIQSSSEVCLRRSGHK